MWEAYAAERRANPVFYRIVELSACGTLGLALPDIIDLIRECCREASTPKHAICASRRPRDDRGDDFDRRLEVGW